MKDLLQLYFKFSIEPYLKILSFYFSYIAVQGDGQFYLRLSFLYCMIGDIFLLIIVTSVFGTSFKLNVRLLCLQLSNESLISWLLR